MQYVRTMTAIVALGVVATVGAPAQADNFAPPEYVGAELSVSAEWEFNDGGANPSDPSFFTQVADDANEREADDTITRATVTDMSWLMGPDNDGRWVADQGSIGTMSFDVANWIDFQSTKFMRVQITFGPDESVEPVDDPTITQVTAVDNEIGAVPPENIQSLGIEQFDQGRIVEDFMIQPNPDHETVVMEVPQGTFVDQVWIDTVSVPEPASMALLGAGGLGLLARRRR